MTSNRIERLSRYAIIAALLAVVFAIGIVFMVTRGRCTPATPRPCDCEGGTHGQQVCLQSGRDWSACSCSTASADGGADGAVALAGDAANGGGGHSGGSDQRGGHANNAGGSSANGANAADETGANGAGSNGTNPSANNAANGTNANAGSNGGLDAGAGSANPQYATANGNANANSNNTLARAAGEPEPLLDAGAPRGSAPRNCSAWSGYTSTCSRCVVNFRFENARAPRDVYVGACDRMGRGPINVQLSAVTTGVRDGARNAMAAIDWQVLANDAVIADVHPGPRPVSDVRQANVRMNDFHGGAVRLRVRLARCTTTADTTCTGNVSLVVSNLH
jgi:hypothetical protein